MKTLTMFGIIMIVFTGCGVLAPQETQEERRRLLAMQNAARARHNPDRIKQAVKDLLVGKWQYVGLEVEEGSVNAQRRKPMSQQGVDSLNTGVAKLPKSVVWWDKQRDPQRTGERCYSRKRWTEPSGKPTESAGGGNAATVY